MKINEIKLVSTETVGSLNNTGFRVSVSNSYEMIVEETTGLGFKATNTIQVPNELANELNEFLNGFAQKCLNHREQQNTFTVGKDTQVKIDKYKGLNYTSNHII